MDDPTIPLVDLPPGAAVRGVLYADPGHRYESGDVLEVELADGTTVDVSWEPDNPFAPFRVVVYREHLGNRFVDITVTDPKVVAGFVESMSRAYHRLADPGLPWVSFVRVR